MSLNFKEAKPLLPIPTPRGRWWREFRIQVLPLFTFAAAVATAALIWRQNISAPTFQGQVEPIQAKVASPQPGTITQLKVIRFQKVTRGEAVALVMPTDPRGPLALIQSEMDLLRARVEPRLSQQRNAIDYERLRLEWLLQKAELAERKVQLLRAESELRRNKELFEAKLLSPDLYELSEKNRDQLKVEVEEKEKVIADLDKGLQGLQSLGAPEASPVAEAMLSEIKTQEQRIQSAQTGLGPITLRAPIDGTVSMVYHQVGENIRDGEPILVISASESQRIVGYLRPPFSLEPEVGMPVEVRTRSRQPVIGLAQVMEIGSQIEPITNGLSFGRSGVSSDFGLAIAVSLPSTLKARPGEVVDLVMRPLK